MVLAGVGSLQFTATTLAPGAILSELPGDGAPFLHAGDQWQITSYRTALGRIVDRDGRVLAETASLGSGRTLCSSGGGLDRPACADGLAVSILADISGCIDRELTRARLTSITTGGLSRKSPGRSLGTSPSRRIHGSRNENGWSLNRDPSRL